MIAALLLLALGAGSTPEPATDDAAVHAAIGRGLTFLVKEQNADGSWGGHRNAMFPSAFGNPATYHCWQVGTTALVVQALIELDPSAEAAAAAERGLDYLVRNAELRRPAEWDLDNNWGLIYGLNTLSIALKHPRYAGSERESHLRRGAETMLAGLQRFQSARGGWGYYADPDAGWRPDWATSFTTAAGVLALLQARDAGLTVDDKMLSAAVRAVAKARLPNGAYDYDVGAVPRHMSLESINQVKGSLGRIQVCNYALVRAGSPLPDDAVATGVEQFFRHHRFLDVARNKPIPHEAYYANAAYFYLFGHYYAAFTIGLLPAKERAEQYVRLRREILKCQQADGSMWDFWIANNTRMWGTAFGVMALARSLDPVRD